MKRFFCIVCFLASVSAVFAQTQHGYVKTRGRMAANGTTIPGTRLSGATLTLRGNNSVVSGNNGVFTFAVPSKTFCLMNVQKNGYQLYDYDLLGKKRSYSANDLLVVMDTPDNVLADKLASERKIRRTLQRQLTEKEDEIEALKEQQKITEEQYQKQLQALYKAQENNEKLISEMAERYSTLDFDQLDDFQCRVAALIQNGELTRANSLLNTKGSMDERSAELDRESAAIKENAEDLRKRQEEQAKSEALYAKKLQDFGADCYSRFEICKLRHDNDSAAYWIKLRASKDTTNARWLLEAGIFVYEYQSKYDAAILYIQQALDISTREDDERNLRVASCCNDLGTLYVHKRDFPKALEYLEKAISIRMERLGPSHPNVATCLNNVGGVYEVQGDYSKALEYFEKALSIRLESLGENHPNVATSYNNIGGIYIEFSKYDKAEEYISKALKIRLETLGDKHPSIINCYNNLGLIYAKLCKCDKALEIYQKALQLAETIYGRKHPKVATCLNNIGGTYRFQRKYDLAIDYLKQAQNIW